MASEAVNQAVARLLRPGGRTIALLGAGVSVAPPSCFPRSSTIIESIIDSVLKRTEVDSSTASDIKNSLREVGLPLEYFSQIAVQALGRDFVEVFPGLANRDAAPNSFHLFIALAASRGLLEAVLTPNFDEFLESAMLTAGLKRAALQGPVLPAEALPRDPSAVRYFRVFSSVEDFAHLGSSTDWNTTRHPGDTVPMIKLHGTLSDCASILCTVESYQSWFLRDRHEAVSTLLDSVPRCHWLFAGYSGRDEIFGWLHPPPGHFPDLHLRSEELQWLKHSRATQLSAEVASFLKTHHATVVEGTAEEYAKAALEVLGAEPARASASDCPPVTEGPGLWLSERPVLQLHNFLAVLCLTLGRFADAAHILRAGFQKLDPDYPILLGPSQRLLERPTELPEWIKGLWHLSVARAGLGMMGGATSLIERAAMDWELHRGRLMAGGVREKDWERARARLRLWHGYALHLRNRNILDQVAAWDLMTQAGTELDSWHSSLGLPRNFQSSPEYAELNWHLGRYLLRGGDLDFASRCFARMWDVDVFNVLQMGGSKLLLGQALAYEAEGLAAEPHMYGASLARSKFEAALSLAEAALDSVSRTYQLDVVTDILLLLGRVSEKLGQLKAAADYLDRAAGRLYSVQRDVEQADEVSERVRRLRDPELAAGDAGEEPHPP